MNQFTVGDVATISAVLIGWIAAVIRMDKRLAILEEIVRRHDHWIEREEERKAIDGAAV